MKIKYLGIACCVVVLSACQTTYENKQFVSQGDQQSGASSSRYVVEHYESTYISPSNTVEAHTAVTKPLSDYAADLAMQLAMSIPPLPAGEPIVVSSFVNFDRKLRTAGVIGNQLAEHLYHHLHQMGVPVADSKANSSVNVTSRGDYLLSRSQRGTKRQRYALTGTMLRDTAGIVVNARIIQLQSQAVVSTAQIHIPAFVLAGPAETAPSILSSP